MRADLLPLRPAMIAVIRAVSIGKFQSEIAHYMGIEEREYAYDELSALFDIMMTHQEKGGDKFLLRIARQKLFDIGFYRIMPPSEIANTFRMGGGPVWDFKLNGVPYISDDPIDDWQWPEDESDDESHCD